MDEIPRVIEHHQYDRQAAQDVDRLHATTRAGRIRKELIASGHDGFHPVLIANTEFRLLRRTLEDIKRSIPVGPLHALAAVRR
jgi:hypothetical protein